METASPSSPVVSPSTTPVRASVERRASDRLRHLNQKYKTSNEQRSEIYLERKNARLEALENDGLHNVEKRDNDGEYNPDEDGTQCLSFFK